MLRRRHEGQLHRLALVIAGLRRGAARGHAHRLVGVGLDPGRLHGGLARWRVAVRGRPQVLRERAPLAPLQLGEADVGGDGVEPRPGRALLAQPGRATPGAHQGLLDRVVGVVHRAEHAVAVGVELGPVQLDEIGEVPILAGGPFGQDGFSTTINV